MLFDKIWYSLKFFKRWTIPWGRSTPACRRCPGRMYFDWCKVREILSLQECIVIKYPCIYYSIEAETKNWGNQNSGENASMCVQWMHSRTFKSSQVQYSSASYVSKPYLSSELSSSRRMHGRKIWVKSILCVWECYKLLMNFGSILETARFLNWFLDSIISTD